MRNANNFDYLHDLEARLRKLTHNEDERGLFIGSAPDRLESWALPVDGSVEPEPSRELFKRWLREAGWSAPIL